MGDVKDLDLDLPLDERSAAFDEARERLRSVDETMPWIDVQRTIDEISNLIGEWEGIPVPLADDLPFVLRPGHPLSGFFERRPAGDDDGERVVNHWFSRKLNAHVYVVEKAGRYAAVVVRVAPDRSMERLTLWLRTLGASDAWMIDAEHRARDLLRSIVSDRQWKHYDLTGSFLETSPRSGLTYLFRRLRPTVVLTPRGPKGSDENDAMRCLAVLCLHPIGYYAESWAGCMCPTDDVIAHLMLMRGDEVRFWKQSIQHRPSDPEAGL